MFSQLIFTAVGEGDKVTTIHTSQWGNLDSLLSHLAKARSLGQNNLSFYQLLYRVSGTKCAEKDLGSLIFHKDLYCVSHRKWIPFSSLHRITLTFLNT